MTSPLRDRFGVHLRLEYYTEEELTQIIIRTAEVLGTAIDEESALKLRKEAEDATYRQSLVETDS